MPKAEAPAAPGRWCRRRERFRRRRRRRCWRWWRLRYLSPSPRGEHFFSRVLGCGTFTPQSILPSAFDRPRVDRRRLILFARGDSTQRLAHRVTGVRAGSKFACRRRSRMRGEKKKCPSGIELASRPPSICLARGQCQVPLRFRRAAGNSDPRLAFLCAAAGRTFCGLAAGHSRQPGVLRRTRYFSR